jgi:hypothetical protein
MKKLSARVKRRRARLRRDAFGRMALGFEDYLRSVGWHWIIVGKVQVVAQDVTKTTPGAFGRYQALVHFTGGKFTKLATPKGAKA